MDLGKSIIIVHICLVIVVVIYLIVLISNSYNNTTVNVPNRNYTSVVSNDNIDNIPGELKYPVISDNISIMAGTINAKHKVDNKPELKVEPKRYHTVGNPTDEKRITQSVLTDMFIGYQVKPNVTYVLESSNIKRSVAYDFGIKALRLAVDYYDNKHKKADQITRDRAKVDISLTNGVFYISIPAKYKSYDDIHNHIVQSLKNNPASKASKMYQELSFHKA